MRLTNHIRNWANISLRESVELGEIDETNYPCTDGFPQAEKDICTCPDCGEKMYENVNNNGAYDHFSDIFQEDGEITVTQEDDAVYISLDASVYDSDAYAELGFEKLKKTVWDEIQEINKYDKGEFSVEVDMETPYTLKITGDIGLDEAKCNEDSGVYTSDEQIPELMVNEENEETVAQQDQMTLKEFFNKAKSENGELQVHFTKVTDNQERTVIFSNAAGVGASFEDSKIVSPKTLKTITKNHDRVYEQDVKYTGSLVTFPEKVTEETPHVSNVQDAEDGTQWQWRRLYIQQIIDVKYNGKIVWENNGLFNFSLIGQDGKIRTTVSKDEIDRIEQSTQEFRRKMERENAEYKVMRRKAVDLAKIMSEEDCSVDLGYSAMNGFDYLAPENKIRVLAIQIKHDELCRTNPQKHRMKDTSRNSMRGDHSEHCEGCGFGYSWDSSD